MSCNDLPIPTEHAKQLACDLASAIDNDKLRKPAMVNTYNGSLYLAAQLLTKYEPEPVDPDDDIVAEIFAVNCDKLGKPEGSLQWRSGYGRNTSGFVLALAAYKAGKAASVPKETPAVSLEDHAAELLAVAAEAQGYLLEAKHYRSGMRQGSAAFQAVLAALKESRS